MAVQRHARIAGQPGHDLQGGEIGAAIVFRARTGARQARAPDRWAGESRAWRNDIVQIRQRYQLALGRAVDVRELREHEAHAFRGQLALQLFRRTGRRTV